MDSSSVSFKSSFVMRHLGPSEPDIMPTTSQLVYESVTIGYLWNALRICIVQHRGGTRYERRSPQISQQSHYFVGDKNQSLELFIVPEKHVGAGMPSRHQQMEVSVNTRSYEIKSQEKFNPSVVLQRTVIYTHPRCTSYGEDG
ncbi:hypothetical protein TNCV_3203351 [Trichonephila clavipes]|nr:hypothetical protein TNCV_3203351 [Trichonephila clavipes]